MPAKKTTKTEPKPGRKTTEFWGSLADKVIGSGLIAAGLFGPADKDTGRWLVGIGAGLILGGQSVYTWARTRAKQGGGK